MTAKSPPTTNEIRGLFIIGRRFKLESTACFRWRVLLLLLVLAIWQWVWSPILIRGDSMLPGLRSGRIAGVYRLAYWFHPPARGDVVLLWTGKERLVKRVVGLPGEEIASRDGILYINGSPLKEPYVMNREIRDVAPGRIEPDRFVVVGDNRSGSMMLVIRKERIIGRVVWAR